MSPRTGPCSFRGFIMLTMNRRQWLASAMGSLAAGITRAAEPDKLNWLQATAYAIPKETTNQGSGYFSIVPGLDGKLYVGTAKYGVGSFLVEFDPKAKE